MSLYSPLYVEDGATPRTDLGPVETDEATPKTDLGKTFKQLQHKKKFQEVVAGARVASRFEESCWHW